MWHRNLGKIILAAIICAAIFYLIFPLDLMLKGEPRSLALIPHEDPETAEQMFSGIPSFVFDPDYLNVVLQMDPEKIKAMLEERPFRRISQNLKEANNSFTMSKVYVSGVVMEINEDLSKLGTLAGQNRFDEAAQLVNEIHAKLSQANRELKRLEEATEATGDRLKVSLAPAESSLRRSYDEALEAMDKGRETLALNKDILAGFPETLAGELLNLTEVTLKIEPAVAFVGDNIYCAGVLTSEEGRLAGREVDILLNGSRYATTRTYSYGHYQYILRVPYEYTPELDLQVRYYPGSEDVERDQYSLSPVIKLKVLFYGAELEIAVEEEAYPGLETTIIARFDYGQSPPPKERNVEIHFDNVLITEVVAQEAFTQKIRIDPEVDAGEHTITVSAAAVGRYAQVVASAILNVASPTVTRVDPILDLNTPTVAMIPGDVGLSGKLYSEAGPLSGASIKMGLGKSQVELVSSEDGTFDTKVKTGMGFGLIGWQELAIEVLPQEPWHAPLNTTSRILMVNIVNCGVFSAVLVFLGIYLPGRLRRRLGAYPKRAVRPAVVTIPSEPTAAYSERVTALTSIKESDETSMEPRNRIFHWYRLIVKLIHGITRALLKPQQTLREFATESSRALGPAAQYFIELTRMVERLLYSQYRPTEEDAGKSKQLSNTIEEELKGEGV